MSELEMDPERCQDTTALEYMPWLDSEAERLAADLTGLRARYPLPEDTKPVRKRAKAKAKAKAKATAKEVTSGEL